jgi:hypothetical protein
MLKKLLCGREVSDFILFSLESGAASEADLLSTYLKFRQPQGGRTVLLLAGNNVMLFVCQFPRL